SSLSANCSSRGRLRVAVTTPKVVELSVVPGVENAGVLFTLNASARNCSRYFSLIGNDRKIEKSRFTSPGPLTSGNVRPTFPYVYAAGLLKAAVLNHCASVWLATLSETPGTTFGRLPPPVTDVPREITPPVSSVVIALICHPPRTFRTNIFCARLP